MLVREIMTTAVITVAPDATLEEVCEIMHARNIRHLPVMEDGRLVGVITDRDVHGATSSLCLAPSQPKGLVRDAMSHPPTTAHPMDPVEDAARTMRSLKIGCLPVLDDDTLVGIITGIDLLDALLRLTGVDQPSGRLELRLADRPGEIAKLTAFISGRQLNIHSVLTYPEGSGGVRTVLRVNTLETRPLADALRKAGFEILWPPEKPWRR
ncbi:MAG TPA: CBS and ACT domain-containing protein [Thermoanaerobaculaceae bacterium]|nr:CBS and ACT domain-containing protein [Thermoanaerobaculaceae bacterium]